MVNVPGKGAPPTFKLSNLASAPTWKIISNRDNAPNTRKTVRTTHRWPKFSPKRAISDSFQTFLLDPNLLKTSNIHLEIFYFFLFWIEFFLFSYWLSGWHTCKLRAWLTACLLQYSILIGQSITHLESLRQRIKLFFLFKDRNVKYR